MNTSTKLLGVALVLMLLAFPLTSIGTDRELTWLWWLGLAVLALGAAIPPVVRFAPLDDEDADPDPDDGGETARKEQR